LPSINKKQVNIIVTAIKNQAREIKATRTWLELVAEFSLGKVSANKIIFNRDDYKKWREILISHCGYDPIATTLQGNRTEVTKLTHHDKWAGESELAKQLSVTVIGGDLITANGRCAVIPEVDYRVNKEYLNPSDYEACMVVENFEAFIFIYRFNLPALGHVLVLYRGHNTTARSVTDFLQVVQGIPIIGFTDPDPAGLGILNDWNCFTHALIPDPAKIKAIPSLHDRFKVQLRARPNMKAELEGKSLQYEAYANWILESGFAGTQEFLCSRGIPLKMVKLR
tara:strand:- start:276 stop:1121 length:846 start_codon:yes stop_codon:yes gene_type:complete